MSEASMIAAHKAGVAYWRMNHSHDASPEGLAFHARTCGWKGEDAAAWLAGYYGEKKRMEQAK